MEVKPTSNMANSVTDALGAPEAVSATARELLPLFYEDVRRLARRERRAANAGVTMQTTVLINEAYLRLRDRNDFNDHAHFLRSAALAMRQALLNHARDRIALKRGAGAIVLPLEAAEDIAVSHEQLLLDINE